MIPFLGTCKSIPENNPRFTSCLQILIYHSIISIFLSPWLFQLPNPTSLPPSMPLATSYKEIIFLNHFSRFILFHTYQPSVNSSPPYNCQLLSSFQGEYPHHISGSLVQNLFSSFSLIIELIKTLYLCKLHLSKSAQVVQKFKGKQAYNISA